MGLMENARRGFVFDFVLFNFAGGGERGREGEEREGVLDLREEGERGVEGVVFFCLERFCL